MWARIFLSGGGILLQYFLFPRTSSVVALQHHLISCYLMLSRLISFYSAHLQAHDTTQHTARSIQHTARTTWNTPLPPLVASIMRCMWSSSSNWFYPWTSQSWNHRVLGPESIFSLIIPENFIKNRVIRCSEFTFTDNANISVFSLFICFIITDLIVVISRAVSSERDWYQPWPDC